MSTLNLLYKQQYDINKSIKIMIPTVGEIIDNEDDYYNMVATITSMPIDLMVQLDDIGIDFTEINEYELFLLTFNGLKQMDTKLIFGDLDLSKFKLGVNPQNGQTWLYNDIDDVAIDRAIYEQIATVLRKIHHLKKNLHKPGNTEAKKYMLDRARIRARRQRNRKRESQIEPLIIAMVNTEQFKYDFEGTRNLTIYQFNESVQQVVSKVEYDNKMHGVYAGTVDVKKLSQSELNWLTH